jgi:hypothetical protein
MDWQPIETAPRIKEGCLLVDIRYLWAGEWIERPECSYGDHEWICHPFEKFIPDLDNVSMEWKFSDPVYFEREIAKAEAVLKRLKKQQKLYSGWLPTPVLRVNHNDE